MGAEVVSAPAHREGWTIGAGLVRQLSAHAAFAEQTLAVDGYSLNHIRTLSVPCVVAIGKQHLERGRLDGHQINAPEAVEFHSAALTRSSTKSRGQHLRHSSSNKRESGKEFIRSQTQASFWINGRRSEMRLAHAPPTENTQSEELLQKLS